MNEKLDLRDEVSRQLSPLEVFSEYLGKLAEECTEGPGGVKGIFLSLDELLKLTNGIDAVVYNINRVIGLEPVPAQG